MRVVIAADHAGFALKETLRETLGQSPVAVIDAGTYDITPVDYPDVAVTLAQVLVEGRADRGVLICGSGVGASVAANKVRGVRAGLCHDTYSAHQGVEHDDMNVLVLGARVIGVELARELVRAFIGARFAGEERFVRRLRKVEALDRAR
ncbi:MAG: ribose 5-phosphate isomerase B [Acidobacteria bacterium]|nr:ribose 5-phosphate isomerase B [Acidobacteriota bacterium]